MTQNLANRQDWFTDARYGMFVHYGAYSRVGRGEWLMAQEGWSRSEYERFADAMTTSPARVREWVDVAKAGGMRYMVLTAKHHDGFCLWNSATSSYNSVLRGPHLDIVDLYTKACREAGLKVGLYYSLADWHHPDGAACAQDPAAHERFIAYTKSCLRELLTSYGDIDVLWFDGPWPLGSPARWHADDIASMIRTLQPATLINDRLGEGFHGDFATSEREIKSSAGRWEACMTMNDDWGYTARSEEDWVSAKDILLMLRRCTNSRGNLLLNVGPMGDGELPPQAKDRLERVGRWLSANAEAVYPESDQLGKSLPFISNTGSWSRRGSVAYYWLWRTWPGTELHLGGLDTTPVAAEILGHKRPLEIITERTRVTIRNLPPSNPDTIAGVPILKLTFAAPPQQLFPYPHTEFVW